MCAGDPSRHEMTVCTAARCRLWLTRRAAAPVGSHRIRSSSFHMEFAHRARAGRPQVLGAPLVRSQQAPSASAFRVLHDGLSTGAYVLCKPRTCLHSCVTQAAHLLRSAPDQHVHQSHLTPLHLAGCYTTVSCQPSRALGCYHRSRPVKSFKQDTAVCPSDLATLRHPHPSEGDRAGLAVARCTRVARGPKVRGEAGCSLSY